jgi:predicted alpha/beta superfamily hydrolase
LPGAAAYFRFLTLELVPLIDATYRTDPTNRIFSGHSLSGEFAMYALYLEDPARRYFTSIISEDCSCWSDASGNFSQQLALPLAMEQAMLAATGGSLPINLVMAGDTTFNENSVAAVYDLIASHRYRGLRSIQPIYGLGHIQMDGPAFDDALSFIFPGPWRP